MEGWNVQLVPTLLLRLLLYHHCPFAGHDAPAAQLVGAAAGDNLSPKILCLSCRDGHCDCRNAIAHSRCQRARQQERLSYCRHHESGVLTAHGVGHLHSIQDTQDDSRALSDSRRMLPRGGGLRVGLLLPRLVRHSNVAPDGQL